MTPTERRTAYIRLLATIDQEIEEARALASNPDLSDDERVFAARLLEYRCRVVKRLAEMIENRD